MLFLSVEGNIGSGKTTLLRKLKDKLSTQVDNHVKILLEPVERFQCYKEFRPLDLFYKEQHRNAGFIQLHITQVLKDFFHENISQCGENIKLFVFERSIYSPKIFLNVLLKLDYITEFEHAKLNEITDDSIQYCIPDCQLGAHHLFFLNTSPETCKERIAKRMRGAESDGITMEYLWQIKNEYSTYLDTFARVNGESSVTVFTPSNECDAPALASLMKLIKQLLSKCE